VFRPLPLFLGLRYGASRQGTPLVAFLSRVSAAGLALGVALLILVLAVMNGFDREMRVSILAMVPHATLHQPGGMRDWQAVVASAETHQHVLSAAPYAQVQAMLMAADQAQAVMLHAVIPEREAQLSIVEQYMVQGSFLDLAAAPHGIVLSQLLADKLGVGAGDAIALVVPRGGAASGKRLLPRIHRASVVGVYASHTEIDNVLVYIPLSFGQQIEGLGEAVHGVQIKVDDLMRAPQIARDVLQQLPGTYYSRDWMQSHGNLFEAIQLSKKLVSFLVFIIIGVAAFNVVTAMIMVVRDKRGDIAILQTMGLGRSDIMQLFVFQGLVIGVIGTVVGALLGVLLAANATMMVHWLEVLLDYQFLKSDVYPVTYLPTDIRLADVALVCGAALGLSLLATLYPAWRATRLLPAQVLRYDK
jgi:lipoprotein-releasing system permease protein